MRTIWMMILFCASAAAGAADIYKWTDAQGRVHYGNQPPAGAEKIEVNAPPSVIQQQKEREQALAEDERTKKQYEECKRSKEQLATYQSAAFIIRKDGLGGEKELNAEERAKLIQITQQRIKESCAALDEAAKSVE